MAGAVDLQAFVGARPALSRDGDLPDASEILASQALRVPDNVIEFTRRDNLTAANPRSGTEIDYEIGRAHGLFIVLDDDNGIAHVAELFEAVKQALVIARMQTNTGLIENIEDADQPGTDLTGQADALSFSPSQRRRRAIESEIMQPD